MEDADNNTVYACANVTMNFFTSGGTIIPSEGEEADILAGWCNVTVVLYADSNARTIKVTADATVPAMNNGFANIPELDLFVWTNVVFDGINSVFSSVSWPISILQWGYTNAAGATMGPFNVPPKPYLSESLGGPGPTDIKLDGPVYEITIPLYVGCNLISSPVNVMMSGYYDQVYPTQTNDNGIPMKLLFGETSAVSCIEAVWWWNGTNWFCYVPQTNTAVEFDGTKTTTVTGYFTAGQGYWIKAEKACTLELSGILMENGPFTPPTYQLENDSWNLVGVTSLNGISISDYLQSAGAGPVWVYYAWMGQWVRNPSWGLWPGEAFWVYNNASTVETIAP
jgi:hypothetical protein